MSMNERCVVQSVDRIGLGVDFSKGTDCDLSILTEGDKLTVEVGADVSDELTLIKKEGEFCYFDGGLRTIRIRIPNNEGIKVGDRFHIKVD